MTVPIRPTPKGLIPADLKRGIRQLANKLDDLVGHTNYMWRAYEALQDAPHDPWRLENAKHALNHYRESASRKDLVSGKFKAMEDALLAALPESEWWTDDFKEVKPSAIMQVVSVLLASFPQNTNGAEIFAAQMAEDVLSWRPHPFSIEEAFRELRLNYKFMPSICEVHSAYKAASSRWGERWEAEENAEPIANDLAALIERTERPKS
jgi:hypothetical protein